MFDGHQAERTVMQFRGHSLPVHQSMSVSYAFTLSHFVSQIHLRDFFRLLSIGMCHFLPVHHFGMACLAGSKVKIQHVYFTYAYVTHGSNGNEGLLHISYLMNLSLRCSLMSYPGNLLWGGSYPFAEKTADVFQTLLIGQSLVQE